MLASIVQFLGLVRWPFLVPYLARTAAETDPHSPRGEALDVVFQAANRYLGVGVGEHLGYLFTGIWSILAGIALCDSTVVPDWLGILGALIGPSLLAGVRRGLRGFRMEAGRGAHPDRLHRLVDLAVRRRDRAASLNSSAGSA